MQFFASRNYGQAAAQVSKLTIDCSRSGDASRRWVFLLGLWALIYVSGVFTPPLLDDADTVHAEAAREMLLRHDWVTLYANGIRYLEKAPLMYWGVAASFQTFGVHEWSARLPLAVAVVALLISAYSLGWQIYGQRGAFYSALVLVTSIGPYLYTRFLIPDILVALWLTLGFGFFLATFDQKPPSRLACWGLAFTIALNVLTKGLIGLVFPVSIIGIFVLLTGQLAHLWRMRLLSSLAVLFLIAAPWHILAALRNPDVGTTRGFLWFYFVNEHFLRYLNKRVPRDYDTVPLLLFWLLTIVWLVPWAAFLPEAVKQVPLRWRELRGRPSGDRNNRYISQRRANLLLLLWALVIIVFFSFSTRQESYTLPALPALALLIGGWLAEEERNLSPRGPRRAGRISSAALFVFGCTAGLVGIFFLFWSKPAPSSDLAELLKKNPNEYALSLGHFLDLTPEALGAFRRPLAAASLSLALGTALNWYLRRRGAPARANLALAAMMVVLLAAVHSAFVTFSPILSSKTLALAVEQQYRAGDQMVIRGLYENASSLNFYTGIHLLSLHPPTGNMWYGSKFPDAPRVWISQEEFSNLWSSPTRVFFWTDRQHPPELTGKTAHVLARSGGKFIYVNF
ncbi:MAG: glycosyltransferase family 39 protein [Acidobacteria bacterium]|nr:glycosyltransferase family 39 protein [Acidobacteriota bacterium]